MSIIIIGFPGAPKVSEDAVLEEKALNELLKKRVAGEFSERKKVKDILELILKFVAAIVKENDNDIDFYSVFQKISEETIDNLPPGGGIFSK